MAKVGTAHSLPEEDPGITTVRQIYDHYRSSGYTTRIMGASFRSIEQVLALAGCDFLTVDPALLQTLTYLTDPLIPALVPPLKTTKAQDILSEQAFRFQINADPMATEKLAEGIRNFVADQNRLYLLLHSRF